MIRLLTLVLPTLLLLLAPGTATAADQRAQLRMAAPAAGPTSAREAVSVRPERRPAPALPVSRLSARFGSVPSAMRVRTGTPSMVLPAVSAIGHDWTSAQRSDQSALTPSSRERAPLVGRGPPTPHLA